MQLFCEKERPEAPPAADSISKTKNVSRLERIKMTDKHSESIVDRISKQEYNKPFSELLFEQQKIVMQKCHDQIKSRFLRAVDGGQ